MSLTLYQMGFSPNSIKVQMVLNFKGVEYSAIEVDPMDRKDLIAKTGQALTPAIDHDGVILFDSQAILRYLDANIESTARVFPVDPQQHSEVEDWESWSKREIYSGIGTAARKFMMGTVDEQTIRQSRLKLHECVGRIEAALEPSGYLVGDGWTAADFTAASALGYAFVTAEQVGDNPLLKFCHENLTVAEGFANTRDWIKRISVFRSNA